MRREGLAEDVPCTVAEEAAHLLAALAASVTTSAGGAAAQPPASGSAASASASAEGWTFVGQQIVVQQGVVNFVAADEVVFVAVESAARPDPAESEAQPEASSAGTSAAVSTPRQATERSGSQRAGSGVSLAGIPLTSAQQAARRQVGEDRLQRAAVAGRQALLKEEGQIECVAPSLPIRGAGAERRVFVLIRGRPGVGLSGFCPFRWQSFKGYVCNDEGLVASCVFHGSASQAEALEYWQAVHGARPWPLLLPRP